MVLLENDAFLTELTKLYNKTKETGSVWVTMKQYEHKVKQPRDEGSKEEKKDRKKLKTEHLETDTRCLMRATDGKTKVTTHVLGRDVVRFQLAYSNILKSQMDSLKRKEKKKKKKATESSSSSATVSNKNPAP